MGGHHDGGMEAATIALICCVYNPETGDAEGAEQDLARLMSDTGRVLCHAGKRRCREDSSSQQTAKDDCCLGKRPR